MAKKEDFIPTDLVKRLYGDGRGETEVIMQLRAQGFTPSQIDKAMKAVPKPVVHRAEHAQPPAELPKKEHEAYRGALPRELIRQTERAEMPEHRSFAEPAGGGIGLTTEKVNIPEELRPMEIMHMPASKAPPQHAPAPVHAAKVEERQPAPVSAAVPGAPKISLEELVEQIVGEEEKKLFVHLNKVQSEHDANVKKIGDVSAKLDIFLVELRALQKTVDDKSAFSSDANKSLAVKVAALETAFKELAHHLHRK